jgi:hypothetical protein
MHGRPASRLGTIAKVEIDESLVRNVQLRGESFEVVDCRGVEPNGYGLLETLGVGISSGLGEIVLFSHRFHRASYWTRSDRVARRAEISRIVSLSSRSQ